MRGIFPGKGVRKNLNLGIPITLATLVCANVTPVSISGSDSSTIKFLAGRSAQAQVHQDQTPQATDWGAIEQSIIAEHNRVRQNPQSYIPLLEAHMAKMTEDGHIIHGCGQDCVRVTQEGQAAVEEAIAFLRAQPPVDPIDISSPVAQAAKALAQDQANGQTGHISSDGSSFLQRLPQFGVNSTGIGENISYGATSAQDVVMTLLIDDGVPSRGHRSNVFAANWDKAGAGCGDHATYRTVCVIDYAR